MAEENEAQRPNRNLKVGEWRRNAPALLIILLMPVISFAMFKFLFLPEIKAYP